MFLIKKVLTSKLTWTVAIAPAPLKTTLCLLKMDEKQKLERGALEQFAILFNSKLDRGELKFVEHLDPPYPDLKCKLKNDDLFVEIAHSYGTSVDARKVLRHGKKGQVKEEEEVPNVVAFNLEDRIVGEINATIYEHSLKDYKVSPIWLLIRIGNFLYDLEEFESYKHRILIPVNNKFNEIWLLCGPRSDSGAVQLWSQA